MLILLGWVRSGTAWTYSLNTESTYKWVADKWSIPIRSASYYRRVRACKHMPRYAPGDLVGERSRRKSQAHRYRALGAVVGGIGRLDAAVAKGPNMLGQETVKVPFLGAVVSVHGSVVDIRFDEHLPPIYSVLRAGGEGRIIIEVLAQLDARHVRGIALTPTQGLARGMAVEDTGGPLKAPVGKEVLSRMFDVFGNVIDRESA